MAITPDTHILLADLIHRFWAVIDEQSDSPGPDFFTPDGALVIESFEASGRDALIRYFAGRRMLSQEKTRATRHLCSNLRLVDSAEGRALFQVTITVFSGYGAWPMPLGAPSTLCDFSFDCVQSGGDWRFARVEGLRIFAGADTPDLARAQATATGAEA